METQRTYLAIDLKSFYASVECVDRHLDPLTTNLVVADASRTEKTICLAVSPSLKAYRIPGRARLFEVVQRVRKVNAQRLQAAIRQRKAVRGEDGRYHFASTSFHAAELSTDPSLGLSYIVAPPRMQRYLNVSTQIYKTYLKYVSPEDIYPYSIDEVFIDATGYEDAEAYTAEKEAAAQAEQERKQAEEDAKKAEKEAAASGSEQTGGNKITKYAATFLGVLVLVGLAAGGGIYAFMKQKKKAEKEALDPDADYTEDKGGFEIPMEDEPEETGEEDNAEE